MTFRNFAGLFGDLTNNLERSRKLLYTSSDVAHIEECHKQFVQLHSDRLKAQEEGIRKTKGLPIEIIVYGNVDDKELVGSNLSSAGIFLQEPEASDILVEYRNPHVFSSDSDSQTPFFRMHNVDDWIDLQESVDAIIHAPTAATSDAIFKIDPRIKWELRRLVFLVLAEQSYPYLATCLATRFQLWPSCFSEKETLLPMKGLHYGISDPHMTDAREKVMISGVCVVIDQYFQVLSQIDRR